MGYIKDLYTKKPEAVKKLIKKLFNLEKEEDVYDAINQNYIENVISTNNNLEVK